MRICLEIAVALLALSLSVCGNRSEHLRVEHKASAERFFRGVYGCDDPAVVDDLANDDIVVSYPIFETVFGRPAIRGREAVKEFSARFCQKWTAPQITIHETIGERDRVVLLWSFRARNAGTEPQDQAAANREHSWGGITLFRFDGRGKIVAEVGEESEPGPAHRMGSDAAHR